MKRSNTWAGFALFGIWLTSSAIAHAGGAFQRAGLAGANVRAGAAFRNTALVRDATISRQAAALGRTALIRDATRFGGWLPAYLRRGDGSRFGPYAYRSFYDGRNHRDRFDRRRDGYAAGAGPYGYADPYGYGDGYPDAYGYGYGYPDNYLYPGGYGFYPGNDHSYPDAPEYDEQGMAAMPAVTTVAGLVTAVQTKLTRQAYYDGPLDGMINEEVRHAIREYQQDHGLPVTGLINPDLLSSMAIRYTCPLT